MQFVSNGPDIPDNLLELHEEGKVVFFCGAGISRNAGLPDFKGLTEQLYKDIGEPPSTTEQKLIDNGQYDLAINLLEGRTAGERSLVRRQLAKILTPSSKIYEDDEALAVHRALLTLSNDKDERYKLITTNFDRIFEEIIAKDGLDIYSEVAPHLPLPKKSRWNSIVYLHGLLPEILSDNDLNRLVISSGDFGLAYLIERWASRFVTELFRNYTVCFVGYGINDPVMRYMMDALAADRLLGESSPDMFVFMSYSDKDKKEELEKEWQAKSVTPLLYNAGEDHHLLKDTLVTWADTYRDGIFGKEQIIVRYAPTKPDKSTAEDNFIDRMLWALSDPSGLPAKRFSEISPTPSLDWLDLITQHLLRDENRNNISLVSHRDDFVFPLDNTKKYIVKWLINYIDDSRLVLWIAKYGGRIHPTFVREIEHALEAKQPSKPLLGLWYIILTERLISGFSNFDVYRWSDLLKINGFSPALRMHLREILKPLVKINKSLDIYGEIYPEDNINKYIDWEIELVAHHAKSSLALLEKKPEWTNALPALLADFTTLLQDTIEIMVELGEAEEKHDTTSWHMPSIEDHSQNRGFRDWTLLIELVRDAWIETLKSNPEIARIEVMRWQSIRYPVFRRLTFYAGTKTNLFSNSELIMWLLEDDYYWLWSGDTKREAIRLLVSLAVKINPSECEQIENAILLGVPRNMYRNDLEAEEFEAIQDHGIWLLLAKLHQSGASLSEKAVNKLNALSKKYSNWELAEDERDEFTTWMSSGFDGEEFNYAPKGFDALKEWLEKEKKDSAFERDNWDEFTSKYVLYSSKALIELAKEEKWNISRWNTALYAWARVLENKKSIYTYWSKIGEQLLKAPDKIFKELVHGFSYWLQAVAKQTNGNNEKLFFELVAKVLKIYEVETVDAEEIKEGDQVSKAINHPVGHMMKAVLSWWKYKELSDGMNLDVSVEAIFSQVCNSDNPIFSHGQFIIATDTIALYRVDQKWTQEYLLPLFDWIGHVDTAPGVWKGLLWSPRLYKPLFKEIKSSFLEASKHCEEMQDFGKQYANLLTFSALDPGDIFNQNELRDAVRSLPPECLENSISTLGDLLSSSSKKQEYWTNKIKPYLHHIWPKDSSYLTDEIIDKFTLLCVDSDEIFPEVFETIKIWLKPLDEDPHYILHKMKDKELCKRFPDTSLIFLCKIIEDNIDWSHKNLKECLEDIVLEQNHLESTLCYKRLWEIVCSCC